MEDITNSIEIQFCGFFIEEAKQYGLGEAILLNYIRQCLATGTVQFDSSYKIVDGEMYVKYSYKDLSNRLYFLNSSQIRRLLNSLVKQKKLKRKKLSLGNGDCTYWYKLVNQTTVVSFNA